MRVADLGSLSKAAAVSNIAVAAASRRMAQLEHQYRSRLLVRSARGVTLTPAGELLRAHAAGIVEGAFELQAAMAAHTEHCRDVVRVAANTSAVTCFLPADLASFQARLPGYRLEVVERHSRGVVEAVQYGDADLGIFSHGPNTSGLRTFAYRADRLAAVIPRAHPLTGPEVRFEQVLDFELVGLEQDGTLSRLIAEQATAAGRPAPPRLQMKSFQSVCRMVKSGMGIGLLPMRALREMATLLDLRLVPLSDAWATRSLWICVRGPSPPRPALQSLLDHLVPPDCPGLPECVPDARDTRRAVDSVSG